MPLIPLRGIYFRTMYEPQQSRTFQPNQFFFLSFPTSLSRPTLAGKKRMPQDSRDCPRIPAIKKNGLQLSYVYARVWYKDTGCLYKRIFLKVPGFTGLPFVSSSFKATNSKIVHVKRKRLFARAALLLLQVPKLLSLRHFLNLIQA